MAITQTIINDKIEVLNLPGGYPVMQIREAKIIFDDGVEIARQFHRYVLTPDADLSQASPDIKAIADAVFTTASKDAFSSRPV